MPPGALQQTPPPPQILRASPSAPVKEPPPKPSVSIAVVTSGIVLSWNMVLEEKHATVHELSAVCAARRRHSGERSPVEEDRCCESVASPDGLHAHSVFGRQ